MLANLLKSVSTSVNNALPLNISKYTFTQLSQLHNLKLKISELKTITYDT